MITKAVLDQLYTPIYDEFMLQVFDEDSQVAPKIFREITDHTEDWLWDGLSGLGRWVPAAEGAAGGYEDPTLGYPKTLTQRKFWKKFQVSFEAVDQDEYALLKREGEARAMGRGARDKCEYDAAQVLYGGFSNTGPDGVSTFSATHPRNRDETTTYRDNLLSGAFSHDNLEDAEKEIKDNFFDPAGIPIAITENPLLLYPPALRGAVERVLNVRAVEQPDTTMRNINRFAGRYIPIEWNYLSAALGASDTAWYIIFRELGFLVRVWSAKPHFTSWVDEDNEYYKFKGRMLKDEEAVDWRCGFASTGT